MARRRLIKISLLVLCLLMLLGGLYNYSFVSITPPMVGMPVIITRNGQEVPPEQIRSVRYLISVHPTKSPQEIHTDNLREADHSEYGYYHIGAAFSIYRYGLYFPYKTEVKPEFRSVFLRITFADGKTLSFSYPIHSDIRGNMAVYVDVSDPQTLNR